MKKARRNATLVPKPTTLRLEALETRELLDAAGGFVGIAPPVLDYADSQFADCEAPLDLSSVETPATNAATTWIVSSTDDDVSVEGTLRHALANADDGDAIAFDASLQGATIVLSGTQLEIANSITIDASNLWNDATQTPGITIDANQTSRVFYVASGDVAINGLAITNGKESAGGGIYVDGALALTNCAIGGNSVSGSSSYGGGIYIAETGTGTLTNCTISENAASSSTSSSSYAYGAGVYIAGSATLTDCEISGNTASASTSSYLSSDYATAQGGGVFISDSGAGTFVNATINGNKVLSPGRSSSKTNGGGVYVSGAGTGIFTNVSVDANQSDSSGGGAYFVGAGVSLENSSFNANTAKNSGGGIYAKEDVAITGCSIVGNTVSSNSLSCGGGIYLAKSGTLTDCAIDGNVASTSASSDAFAYGGGVYIVKSGTLTNCSIDGNASSSVTISSFSSDPSKSYGGGVYISKSGTGTLTNCSIADNTVFSKSTYHAYSYGGGVHLDDGATGTLANCAIVGNVASGVSTSTSSSVTPTPYGGGICVYDNATANLANCTIVGNVASNGAGAYVYNGAGTTSFANCVVTMNLGDGDNIYGAYTLENSLIGENPLFVQAPIFVDGAVVNADEVDLHLAPYSPYIDYLDEGYLGAYEFTGERTERPSFVVTTLEDEIDFTNDATSLREAIALATAGDTITFAEGLTGSILLNGELFADSAALIDGDGRVTLDGGGARRVVRANTINIANTTIANGKADNGGGVYALPRARGTFTNCSIVGNSATSAGGGAYLAGDGVVFENCAFSENVAKIYGGGVYAKEDYSLANCSIMGNIVQGSSSGYGGGVYFAKSGALSDCSIVGNVVSCSSSSSTRACGGGVYIARTGTFTNCAISGNDASARTSSYYSSDAPKVYGGGVYVSSSGAGIFTDCAIGENSVSSASGSSPQPYGGGVFLDNSATGTFATCTISENTAKSGGGVCLYNSSTGTFTNCSVEGNTATSYGGGVYLLNSSKGTFTNSLIVDNKSTSSGGGVYVGSSATGTFANCAIAGNAASSGSGAYVHSGSTNSSFKNCIVVLNSADEIYGTPKGYNTTSSFTNWSNAGASGVVNYVYDETLPLFKDAENGDYSLPENSQAINLGNNEYVATENDFDGLPRVDQGVVDLGPREYQRSRVTTLEDVVDPLDDLISLREAVEIYAIDDCVATFADEFAGRVFELGGTQLTITRAITIDASNLWNSETQTPGIVISGGAASRVFYVDAEDVEIRGLAIIDGNADRGGGVYVNQGSATLANCAIRENRATNGGGVYVAEGASGTLVGVALSVNAASESGGGAYFDDVATGAFTNCTISANVAEAGSGAGVFLSNASEATFANSIVALNFGGGNIAGNYAEDASLIGENPLFARAPIFTDGVLANADELDLRLASYSPYVDDNLGAYEFRGERTERPSFVVTTLEDELDFDDDAVSLREAILLATADDEIAFVEGLSGAIRLNSELFVDSSAAINGDGRVALDGRNARRVVNANAINLVGTTIVNGSADVGGGVYVARNGGGFFTNCSIRDNAATNSGGGVYVDENGSAIFVNCAIGDNSASNSGGGASLANNASGVFVNCAISGNSTSGDGGGVYVDSMTGSFTNCTIVGNDGDGVFITDRDSAIATFRNSIVLFNESADVVGEAVGFNTLSAFANWSNASGQDVENFLYDPTLPLFVDAANGDYQLAPFSQAMNVGVNAYVATDVDLAGERRIIKVVDLGAYEYQIPILDAPTFSVEKTASTITLTWNAVEGASGYEIELNGETRSFAPTETTYKFTGLHYSTLYEFVARAVGDDVNYLDSDDVALSVETNPLAPLSVPTFTATATASNEIAVAWDQVPNASSYSIRYAVATETPTWWTASLGKTKTSYAIPNLEPYTDYYVQIRANGDNIEYKTSEYSDAATERTFGEPIAAPSVSATSTASTITLTWNAVDHATGYALDFDGETRVFDATQTTRKLTGLRYSTPYAFVARALGDGGRWLDSSDVAIAVETQPLQPLAAPELSVVETTSDSIVVAWSAIPNASAYTLAYAAKASSPDYAEIEFDPDATSYTIAELEPYAEYYVRIRANGDEIEYETSPYGAVATARTLGEPIAAPSIVATSTASTITLTWSAVENASGYAIDFNGETYSFDAAQTSFSLTGLSYSTSYAFVARALGDGGRWLDSSDVAIAVETQPLQPLSVPELSVVATTSDSIAVAWSAIPNASSYTLAYAVNDSASDYATVELDAAATDFTIVGLEPYAEYRIRIRADGDEIEYETSSYGDVETSRTLGERIAAPSIVATATASTVALTWSAVENATGYELDVDGVPLSLDATQTSHTLAGLTYSTSYAIVARALGDGGRWLDSEDVAIAVETRPLQPLATPELNLVAATSGSLAFEWGAIPNASSYTLVYAVDDSASDYAEIDLDVNTTSYAIANLDPYAQYCVKVRANGDDVEYETSPFGVATALTLGEPLVAPTLAATSTASTITASWSAVENASGYAIDFNGATYLFDASQTSAAFAGLTYSTSYAIVARALGDGGRWLDSENAAITVETTELAPLPTPELRVVETTTDSIVVAWDAIPGANSYTLRYAVDATFSVYTAIELGAGATSYAIPELLDDTTYYVDLRADGDEIEYGNSALSSIVAARTEAANVDLETPTILETSATASTITVRWTAVPRALGYELVYGTKTISSEEIGTATSYTLTGLAANTSYSLKVKAVGDGAAIRDSGYSAIATQRTTPLVQLARPTLAVLRTTLLSIDVSWPAIENASSYTLSYAVKATSPVYTEIELDPTTTSYTISDLAAGTSYYLKVRANGDNVEFRNSAQSSTATAKTKTRATALETPTIIGTTATASTIVATWDAVPYASGYAIICGEQVAFVDADAISGTISGLTANTSYSVQVQALGDGLTTLDSALSDPVDVATTQLVQLSRPVVVATAASSSAIDASWTAIPHASSYTLSYAVKATSPVYTEIELDPTTTSYTIEGLASSTNYYVKVRANGDYVEYKNSSQSPTVTVKTKTGVTVLETPAILGATSTAATITATWDAVDGASGYAVVCDDLIATFDASATSGTVSGLAANTQYLVQVKALGNGLTTADSALSAPIVVATRSTIQLARPVVTATAASSSAIDATWTAISNASSYTLSYAVKATAPVYTTVELDAETTSYSIEGLAPSTNYYVKVRANGDNVEYRNSSQSPTVTVKTKAGVTVLEIPTILEATATAATITATWDAVEKASGYAIICGDRTVTVAASATSGTVSGLTANTEYSIQVKALGNGSTTLDSALSDPVDVTTTPIVQLARPVVTTTAASSSAIDASWTAIPNASSYTLSYAVKASSPVYTEVELDAGTTSYLIEGLLPSKNYYVKVRANGDNVEYRNSSQSPTATVRTLSGVVALETPTIIGTTATAATITASWDAVAGASGYEIICGDRTATVDGSATSGTVAGLVANTPYAVQVKALGNGSTTLDSELSEPATQRTTALVQLSRPALTLSGKTSDSLTVVWTAIPNAASYTLSYAVKSSSPSYSEIAVDASATSFTISDLAASTSYYVKLRANGDNVEYKNSAQSPTITARTLAVESDALAVADYAVAFKPNENDYEFDATLAELADAAFEELFDELDLDGDFA